MDKIYEVYRYAGDGCAGGQEDGKVIATGTVEECRWAIIDCVEDSACPSCCGRPGRTNRDVRFDAGRGQWMVYRGGWYPCEDCLGTGIARRWGGTGDDIEAYHESNEEGCGGWAIRLIRP